MTYWLALLNSELPFAPWIAIALWAALFVGNHLVAHATRAITAGQDIIVVQNRADLERGFRPHLVLMQALFGALIFVFALSAGAPPVYVFLGGGLIVSLTCALGLNLQAYLSAHAMQRHGAVTGSLQLSSAYATRQQVHRLAASALVCAILGGLTGHLALLGGAVLLAATALGYRRRIKE
jgi:hypothetical protein